MQNIFTDTTLSKKIESQVRKALYDFSMLENIPSLAVALSGGKDSLTMLLMLKKILGKGFADIPLKAIYIDGDFSCGPAEQEKLLKKICEENDIEFICGTMKQKIENLNCYKCARKRRKLIFDIAKDNNIDTIAFGHHRDDNIQTLLMNLFHKAEFEGMQPKIEFHKYKVTIIRPLIYVTEKEIINFAKQNDFLKIICKCPLGQTSKRKEIDKIINNINKSFPNIRKNLSRASFVYGLKKALSI
jgi:tRNA(Ile)-lysidine synthetase-like protein